MLLLMWMPLLLFVLLLGIAADADAARVVRELTTRGLCRTLGPPDTVALVVVVLVGVEALAPRRQSSPRGASSCRRMHCTRRPQTLCTTMMCVCVGGGGGGNSERHE
jgi:hypothetical protein